MGATQLGSVAAATPELSAPLPPSRPAGLARPSQVPAKPDTSAPAPTPAVPASEPSRDKPAQDKPAQDKPAQDKPAQDKPAQDKPATPEKRRDAADGISACLRALSAVPGNRIRATTLSKPVDPACGVTDPVLVEALALPSRDKAEPVRFEPPVTLDCSMAAALASWLDISLQPLAQGHFQKDLSRLRVGGGHECRRRNQATVGKMSEHSNGLALDIFAIVLGTEPPSPLAVSVEKPAGEAQIRFLTAIRQSACGAFTTVLGPGSDAAHANHLHLDIQSRRSAATRFCQ